MKPAARRSLDLASLRRLRLLWKEEPRQLTLAELDAVRHRAPGIGQVEAAKQTHMEIKRRIGHRLRDFLRLPFKVMSCPSVHQVFEKYVSAYLVHEEISNFKEAESAQIYWRALAEVFFDNRDVTLLLAQGREELCELDPHQLGAFDAFLERFIKSRIGSHLLGAAFLQPGPIPEGMQKPAGVNLGVLQPIEPVLAVRDLAQSLAGNINADLDEPEAVKVVVNGPADISILYIPSLFRVILREVLRNAIHTTAQHARARGRKPEPVQVMVNRGYVGVFVTVSDHGGGMEEPAKAWAWGPDGTSVGVGTGLAASRAGQTSDDSSTGSSARKQQVYPSSFGLPSARVTARYFGGDVHLQSLLGYGTNAYIHIPELQRLGASLDNC